jgi:hypothetical protein
MPRWLGEYARSRARMGVAKDGMPLYDRDGRSKARDAVDALSSAERYLRMSRGWRLRAAWCLAAVASLLAAWEVEDA